MKGRLTALLAASVLMVSCIRVENLPEEPSIQFRSFALYDSTDILGNKVKAGRITFYFEDGNGDLGIADPDGTSADTTNLFFTLYRKTGGVFTPAADDDILKPSPYRIPYLEPIGQNDVLKGTIDITMLYYFYSKTDTVFYSFYIKDRAGNLSNIDSTCVVVLGDKGEWSK